MPSLQQPPGQQAPGLTSAQVRKRVQAGQVNTPPESPTKTVKKIVLENLFSYFNIIFFIIAGFLIAVGSWGELIFLLVVGANTAIGIIQELHAKKKLDSLSLLSAPKTQVVRDGTVSTIYTAELVQDDLVILGAGNQIPADAKVVSGSVQVNESLITGESDEIAKGPGSELLSGSFVVSGKCYAVLTRVGADSYASRLTNEAKKSKKSHLPGMMRSLNRLLIGIGILIVPIGGLLFYRQTSLLGLSVKEGIETTAAAVIGMIPEGLYLMVSLALAASVLRLATKQTLVQDLKCTETLARVDVLCVDKTGTITQPEMVYRGLIPLSTQLEESALEKNLSDFVSNMAPDNETMQALQKSLQSDTARKALQVLGFSSETKYSAVSYTPEECYVLGAPEFILGPEAYAAYRSVAEEAMADGSRVLLFAGCKPGPNGRGIADPVPLAFVLLHNPVRENAKETFAYFHDQGVTVKVISGDNPVTVAAAARQAGIEGADRYVDAATLDSYEAIEAACEEYNVFGRVRPNQKKLLVQALQSKKHTVAMTGDGVNDVLALKEADCSVAMASGSDVAAQISDLVLMNSDFASMPSVVAEGRRVINNIERAASLYLVKNIFSLILAIISITAVFSYPLTPSQLTLTSLLAIGIPSLILALEPNESLVTGKFLTNAILRALPAAFTDLFIIIFVLLFQQAFQMSNSEISTITALLVTIVGFFMVWKVAKPLNRLHLGMMGGLILALVFIVLVIPGAFSLTTLSFGGVLVLTVFVLLIPSVIWLLNKALEGLDLFLKRVSRSGKHAKQ
ncbi:MAG: HAD-IC family P-type ATPase [Clostridiales bacterium]|nr:HAD-IC family P-type ATPase [Clostridiales bacterium]